ncbi:phosphatidylinositol-glycan biosynthesis class F protein-like [Gigantopelta aegis]|uniref:phosphatidylinositol-glycan biosynthesis class F protein-like n=1 Tax=Gigantopelta aegis TaxID=1735272 RepID=UPI001B888FCC|nr:phosphatidylinositol-glycan biosynthesis class F protein-like [Gigantopelta aegis]
MDNKVGVKITMVVKGLLLLIGSTLFFHALAILYGAPLTESVAETFHFSLMLSATSILPPCVFLGLNLNSWVRVYAHNSAELGPELVVYSTTICSIIGAWLGAFPIPLDWDRPWQIWPVSCLLGTLFAYDFGMILSAILLYYRYHVTLKSKTF